jgi:hypothetical protein
MIWNGRTLEGSVRRGPLAVQCRRPDTPHRVRRSTDHRSSSRWRWCQVGAGLRGDQAQRRNASKKLRTAAGGARQRVRYELTKGSQFSQAVADRPLPRNAALVPTWNQIGPAGSPTAAPGRGSIARSTGASWSGWRDQATQPTVAGPAHSPRAPGL